MHRLMKMTWLLLFFWLGCGGEEYYSSPKKTLERYVNNRALNSREKYFATMNTFRKEDQEWWDEHYLKICKVLDRDCTGPSIPTQIAVFKERFEPAGPKTTEVESENINEDDGTATLVVQGMEIPFVKERGNWKIKGFFGVPKMLAQQYPELAK